MTCNIYFAFRFSKIKTLNVNLKITFVRRQLLMRHFVLIYVASNLFAGMVSVTHTLIDIFPDALNSDNILFTVFMCFTLFLHYTSGVFIASKFVLVGIERNYAYKNRSTYEI